MKEVVSVHVGQTGAGIGELYWEGAAWEEIVDFGLAEGTDFKKRCAEGDGAIFRRCAKGRRRPRAIFVDSSPLALGTVARTENTIAPDALCVSREDGRCMATWAAGRYSNEGKSLALEVIRRARREAEACESLQGFQTTQSCSGGTGSGLGSRIVADLANAFPKRSIISLGVAPSLRTHFDRVTSAYNCALAIKDMTELSTTFMMADNEAMHDCVLRIIQPPGSTLMKDVTHRDVNRLAAVALSGVTAASRWANVSRNGSWEQHDVTLADFATIMSGGFNLAILGVCPLRPSESRGKETSVASFFRPECFLSSTDTVAGMTINAHAVFRGFEWTDSYPENSVKLKAPDCLKRCLHGAEWPYARSVEALRVHMWGYCKEEAERRASEREEFVHCVPSQCTAAYCPVPAHAALDLSATVFAKSTAVRHQLRGLHRSARRFFSRRAFVHSYVGAGMEEGELDDALEVLQELMETCKALEPPERPEFDPQTDLRLWPVRPYR